MLPGWSLTMRTDQYPRGTEKQQRALVSRDFIKNIHNIKTFHQQTVGSNKRFEGTDVHVVYFAAADTLAQQLSIPTIFTIFLLHGVTKSSVSGAWGWSGWLISLRALMLYADLLYRRTRGMIHKVYPLQRIMTHARFWLQDLGLY